MRYNPFEKEIAEINQQDLDKLLELKVAEGWFIEYKSSLPSTEKISHSIAAFANSDGGWYMVGFEEGQNNEAKSICGFPKSIIKQPKEHLRNVVISHISPKPKFESKLIDLDNDRHILIVYISKGLETPYVTKDGRIYRRVGEGSDPVPETDRYSLNRLFEQSINQKKLIEKFSVNQFSLCHQQENLGQCFLESYFLIAKEYKFDKFFEEDFIDTLLKNFTTPVLYFGKFIEGKISFNQIQSSENSFVITSISNPDTSIYFNITIEIFSNGNLKLFFPIKEYDLEKCEFTDGSIAQRETYLSELSVLLSDEQKGHLRFIDGFEVLSVFGVIFNQYKRLLAENSYDGEIKSRFKFTNIWRKVLFLNDINYLPFINKYGLPVNHKDFIEIPEFSDGKVIEFELSTIDDLDISRIVLEALGIPFNHLTKCLNGIKDYL
jgi:hypothetical protein